MQTQIKFLVNGSNSIYGSFSAGDVLRCPVDIAQQFIDAGIAEPTQAAAQDPAAKLITKKVKAKK